MVRREGGGETVQCTEMHVLCIKRDAEPIEVVKAAECSPEVFSVCEATAMSATYSRQYWEGYLALEREDGCDCAWDALAYFCSCRDNTDGWWDRAREWYQAKWEADQIAWGGGPSEEENGNDTPPHA